MANRNLILAGLAFIVVGALITVATYALASSGTTGGIYVVAYGPVIVGVLLVIRGLLPSHAAPRFAAPSPAISTPVEGRPTVEVMERKGTRASVRVTVPSTPPHVVEATFESLLNSARVSVDGKPFQKVRVLASAKTIDVTLSAQATVGFRFWLSRVPQIDVGYNGALLKTV